MTTSSDLDERGSANNRPAVAVWFLFAVVYLFATVLTLPGLLVLAWSSPWLVGLPLVLTWRSLASVQRTRRVLTILYSLIVIAACGLRLANQANAILPSTVSTLAVVTILFLPWVMVIMASRSLMHR